jgi:hypothetical protein
MTNEKKLQAFKLSLWIGIPVSLIGAIFRANHSVLGDLLLGVGGIGALVLFILGVIDVLTNKTTKTYEKVMWVGGFLFFAYLTGVLYFKNYKQHLLPLS